MLCAGHWCDAMKLKLKRDDITSYHAVMSWVESWCITHAASHRSEMLRWSYAAQMWCIVMHRNWTAWAVLVLNSTAAMQWRCLLVWSFKCDDVLVQQLSCAVKLNLLYKQLISLCCECYVNVLPSKDEECCAMPSKWTACVICVLQLKWRRCVVQASKLCVGQLICQVICWYNTAHLDVVQHMTCSCVGVKPCLCEVLCATRWRVVVLCYSDAMPMLLISLCLYRCDAKQLKCCASKEMLLRLYHVELC